MMVEYSNHYFTVVEAVQLSGQVTSFQVPSDIMGSIVKVCPGFITPMVLFSAGQQRAWCSVRVWGGMGIMQGPYYVDVG